MNSISGVVDFAHHSQISLCEYPLRSGVISADWRGQPGLSIAADCDLHNRADLLRQLASFQLPSSAPDSCILLASYAKWGENCPDFLLGEFAFAVWDATKSRLFCCRDHFGKRPLFYWASGSRFAFSSDLVSLLSVPGVPRTFNPARLASWMRPGGTAENDEETFHKGILALPSATHLTVEAGRLTKRIYWNPETQNVQVSPGKRGFEELRGLIFEAVECRIRNKKRVAVLVSGGLDSASILATTARLSQASDREILAITAILPDSKRPQFADERDFVAELGSQPKTTFLQVALEAGGPFDQIENSSFFTSTPILSPSLYLVDAMRAVASQHGAEVLLTGHFGELGPTTWARGYYFELASRLRWMTLAHELWALRATRGLSPLRVLGKEARDWLRPHRHFRTPFLLAPEFLNATGQAQPREKHYWPDHLREQASLLRMVMRSHATRPLRDPAAVPWSFPFLDKRIMEFCLAAPGCMKVKNGYQRYLVRRALDGVLPKTLQWRTSTHVFVPDYYERYRSQLGRARTFLNAIGPKDPVRMVVDVERLRRELDRPETPEAKVAAASTVPWSIYLICFLRQFGEFRS